MGTVQVIIGLMAAAVGLAWLARHLAIPYPVALVVGGLALSATPGLPALHLDPQLVLLLFLPPILYQAALFTSWRDFRANLRPIGMLAVGLVVATTIVVGGALKLLLPELPWAACFAFGAIVSPPDAVAATAIFSRLNIPRRIVTILEGESLVNDATGLVIYKLAVAAAITGAFSIVEATFEFVQLAVAGVAIGLLLGWLFIALHKHLNDPLTEIGLSLVLPYAAWLAAEAAHGSGVLAVVAAGLLRGWYAPEVFSPATRLIGYSTWEIVVFVLNGLVFILIGLQLRDIAQNLFGYGLDQLALHALAIGAVTILARFAWVLPSTYLPRLLSGRLRARDPQPPWRDVVIVGWCGMRGIVSLAAALALPYTTAQGMPFPGRDLLIFLTFAVIIVTLVLQGVSLSPLIRLLGVGEDSVLAREERVARLKTTFAALRELDRLVTGKGVPEELAKNLRKEYIARYRQAKRSSGGNASGDAGHRLRLACIAAERRRLIKLRREGTIGDEVLHRIQRELDLEEVRLVG
ncbi:MAG: Na+/H+ antiporter [Alphaproteobacteria bacterium]|nr:Na+/H+ antiporter [Alphaproteobacteria bacterium]